MADQNWVPDVLGHGFEQLTLPLPDDKEGEVVATLVRHRGTHVDLLHRLAAHGCDVLYVHGWSDYFFQRHLAEFWASQGARFFALDLRKYGRSIRAHQTPGYVTDLSIYDADIAAALEAMGDGESDGGRPLILMGHSTGGLVLSLWASRHPGRAAAIVLNSPWLEFQASAIGREAMAPLTRIRALVEPLGSMLHVDLGFYTRAVSNKLEGEWEYDESWRPARGFATHPAWMSAIFAGQSRVAAGLHIEAPVLSLLSARSAIAPWWLPAMRTSDSVLVVDAIARRSIALGPSVTIARIEGALHDITLSAEPARAAGFDAIARWLRAYAHG